MLLFIAGVVLACIGAREAFRACVFGEQGAPYAVAASVLFIAGGALMGIGAKGWLT